jgi:DNA-binding transcriptional ArsR family regulator
MSVAHDRHHQSRGICYYLRMNASNEVSAHLLPPDQVALAVEVFRMLADGTRIQILWALIDREMPVNELAAAIGKPGPSVSQHLAKLRMARLVRTRRDGTQIYYQLENDHIRELIVDAVHNAEHAGPAIPAHHLVRGGDLTTIHDTPVAAGG